MKQVGLALLLTIAAFAPARATAQQTDPTTFWGATIGVGVPMVAFDAVLFGLAIDAWASGHYGVDQEWAIIEIVWGAIHVAGVGVAIGMSTLAYDPVPLALTFGVPLGVLGAYFITHGLLSLFGEAPVESSVMVSCEPSYGGAQATVSSTF